MIQSPASRAARRSSCQLRSGSLGSVRSSRPNANQRASSSGSWKRRSAMYSSEVMLSRRLALRKPRSIAAVSGQRTPWIRPSPGATRCAPARYSGSASCSNAARSASAKASGSPMCSARPAPSASATGRRAATNATARAVVALVVVWAVIAALWPHRRPAAALRPRCGASRFGSHTGHGARPCAPRRQRRRPRSRGRSSTPLAASTM